jgi:hypothetical protein
MQSVAQSLLARPTSDKTLYNPQFVFGAGLKSTGVMENVTLMVREDDFVLYVMQATL